MPAALQQAGAAAANGAAEVDFLGFSAESTEAGRSIWMKFDDFLFDAAKRRALDDGRDVVTADDVQSSVPDAARKIADEYADAIAPNPQSAA